MENNELITANSSTDTDIIDTQNTEILKQESLNILNKILCENDSMKVQDLTALFNLNQTKKNMARNNKLNEVLDAIVKETLSRVLEHPEEMSNQELLQAIKTIQDALEKNQKQIMGQMDAPLIQINQQNNEVNVGTSEITDKLDRASKERVKTAIMGILNGITAQQSQPIAAGEITEATAETINEGENKDD